MKKATLYRTYFETHTAGIMSFASENIYTVERPWICDDPEETRGGLPFESCIPEGLYEIRFFQRNNGDVVWSLENDRLGVFVRKEDRLYDTDRYACLIHSANRADQVVGCVAPGLGALNRSGGYKVSYSREAMAALHYHLADVTHLEIKKLCDQED